MYQQLWGYKVEDKLYLRVREQKGLNTTGIEEPGYLRQYSVWLRAGRPGDRDSIPGRGKEFFL
jgi:hypothetical protein